MVVIGYVLAGIGGGFLAVVTGETFIGIGVGLIVIGYDFIQNSK